MSNQRPAVPCWRIVVDALPLILVLVLLAVWLPQLRPAAPRAALQPLVAESAAEIQQVFAEIGYVWPPQGPVPRLALRRLPRDMSELEVVERKALFFSSLTPLVLAENERLRGVRARLQELFARERWSEAERLELEARMKRYAVKGDPRDPTVQRSLLARVDEIPLGLALAQAAKESGWGTSRFAQQGQNLFGVWTWDASQGIVPIGRESGKTHLVRVFPDLHGAVRNYLHTLNTGAAYNKLRRLRANRRAAGEPLSAVELAAGLSRYSERGEAYVREVRGMIRGNRLDALDELGLAP